MAAIERGAIPEGLREAGTMSGELAVSPAPFVFAETIAEIAGEQKCQREIVAADRIAGTERGGLREIVARFGETAEIAEDVADADENSVIVRQQRFGFLQIMQRFFVAGEVSKRDAAIAENFGGVAAGGKTEVAGVEGVRGPAHINEDRGEKTVDVRAFRTEFNGGCEVCDGVERTFRNERFAESGQVIDVAGIAANSAFEIGDGEVALVMPKLRDAEEIADGRSLGGAVDRLIKEAKGVRGATALQIG